MAFADDDRYDDDLTDDRDGYQDFEDDDDDDDDKDSTSSRDRAKSQINPYSPRSPGSAPNTPGSGSGRGGTGGASPFRADDVRREYGSGAPGTGGSKPTGSGSPYSSGGSGSGSSYGSGGSSSSGGSRPGGSGSSYSSGGSGSGSSYGSGGSSSSGGSRPGGSGSPYSSGGSGSGSSYGSGGSSSSGGSRPGGSGSSTTSGGGGGSSSSGSRPGGSGSPYSSSGSGGGGSSSGGSRPGSSGSGYGSGGGSSSGGGGSGYGSGGGSSSGGGGSGYSGGSGSSSSTRSTGSIQTGPVGVPERPGSSSAPRIGGDDKKDAKKDEGGGRFGGFFSRGKGDDKKDDKSAPRKDSSKPPEDAGGGLFGGIRSRAAGLLKRGGDEDAKKDAGKPGAQSASGARPGASSSQPVSPGRPGATPSPSSGIRPGVQTGTNKQVEPERTGAFAAISGRLGGLLGRGKKDDAAAPKPDSRGGAGAPSGPRSTGSSPVVGSSSRPAPSGPQPGAASATRQAAARSQTVEAEPRGGIWEGLMGRLRGGPKPETQPKSATKREGNVRVPELDTSGWSLDTKLDLVGIGLMFGAIIMLLTSASGDQGQLMVAVNTFIGQIFGWGAIAVPLVMGAIGAFLLVTRFGDSPPEIDVLRLVGALSGYLALLTLFQFIVVLDPLFGSGDLGTLKLLVEGFTWKMGRGGGFIGGTIHIFLIENIGEIGGFALLVGWLSVSLMLMTRTTATQMVVIVVSLFRSFRVSWQHRQQRVTAERALASAAQAEQQRIAVSRTLMPELKPGIAGALPAGDGRQQPLPIGEEPIPIRLGGQLVSASAPRPAAAVPVSRTGAIGGLLKRLPGRGSNGSGAGTSPISDPETETAPTGGLRGFLSRRSGSTGDAPAVPLTPPPAPAPASGLPGIPVMSPPPPAPPVQSPSYASSQHVTHPVPAHTPPPTPLPPSTSSPSQPATPQPSSIPTPLFNPGQTQSQHVAPAGTRQMDSFAPPVTNNTTIDLPKAPSIETNRPKRQYTMPEYTKLLAPGAKGDYDRKALVERARIIQETLESFGAPGKVVEINTGPVITQFGVEPGYVAQRDRQSRVKVSAIAQLDKDLQLALGARSIRIEAPVPGKGYVGIEVPNDTPMTVSLRDLMESARYKRISSPLALAFGEAVDGTPVAADLTGMPHLLIAGTTGSGKSVMVNAIICSLLLRNTPDKVRFIMVDPKRVELTSYNGIPHLVAPVVVDVERIIGVLKWVTREMDDRYKKFSVAGARNIDDYNRNRAPEIDLMPFIVVIIDELADLMMLAPEEAERYITRIAAMARATGIHLVIATQRPSADVVTGLIKANFPARIAFAVASNIDSRVILDQPGAEKLLGRGDMLYLSGDSPAAQRLQGVFVSDKEIQSIVGFWKAQGEAAPTKGTIIFSVEQDEDTPTPAKSGTGMNSGNTRGMASSAPVQPMRGLFDDADEEDENDDEVDGEGLPDDELYMRAVDLVRRQNGASVSLLQRKMRIGYARAARLIDAMEDRGIVGPAKEGSSKQRDVLPPKAQ